MAREHVETNARTGEVTRRPYTPEEEAAADARAIAAFRANAVVSRFQARAALHGAGLLSAVEAAVANADPITQLAWADALEFRRNSPTIAALAGIVGLTDEQIDNLFIAAERIQA